MYGMGLCTDKQKQNNFFSFVFHGRYSNTVEWRTNTSSSKAVHLKHIITESEYERIEILQYIKTICRVICEIIALSYYNGG